jgi:hypothetical protein
VAETVVATAAALLAAAQVASVHACFKVSLISTGRQLAVPDANLCMHTLHNGYDSYVQHGVPAMVHQYQCSTTSWIVTPICSMSLTMCGVPPYNTTQNPDCRLNFFLCTTGLIHLQVSCLNFKSASCKE